MSIQAVARAVYLIFGGLAAGILVGYLASRPARSSLDPSSFLQHQQLVHIYYQPMMQVLMLGAIVAGIIWLVTLRTEVRSARFGLAAFSLVCFLAIVVMTLAVNVPLNNEMMTWDVASPPNDLRNIWSAWESMHEKRTVAAVIGFCAAVVSGK